MAIYLIDDSSLLIGPIDCPVVPGMGMAVPGNAVKLDAELPQPDADHLWVWVDEGVHQLPDRRGLVYHTQSGAQQEWAMPGELPHYLTAKPYPGPFHIWVDGDWRLDEQAQMVELTQQAVRDRDALLAAAAIRIAPLQDAVELGKASSDEEASLRNWKLYRVDLNRIEDQPHFPRVIDWPVEPGDMKPSKARRR